VQGGTFEFTVYHEGALTVVGSSITFAAFRSSADRRDPRSRDEDYTNQPRRPETTGSGCSATNKACTPTG
jgi:hypothetical protein